MNNLDFWRGTSPLLRDWNRGLDRMFADDFFRRPMADLANFNPSCELMEDRDSYIAKLEVPGIPKDAIKIDLHDNVLTISGEKKEERRAEGKRRYTECTYGSFARTFSLPTPVNAEKVNAVYDNGVLSITLAKAEGRQGRQIQVR